MTSRLASAELQCFTSQRVALLVISKREVSGIYVRYLRQEPSWAFSTSRSVESVCDRKAFPVDLCCTILTLLYINLTTARQF